MCDEVIASSKMIIYIYPTLNLQLISSFTQASLRNLSKNAYQPPTKTSKNNDIAILGLCKALKRMYMSSLKLRAQVLIYVSWLNANFNNSVGFSNPAISLKPLQRPTIVAASMR